MTAHGKAGQLGSCTGSIEKKKKGFTFRIWTGHMRTAHSRPHETKEETGSTREGIGTGLKNHSNQPVAEEVGGLRRRTKSCMARSVDLGAPPRPGLSRIPTDLTS